MNKRTVLLYLLSGILLVAIACGSDNGSESGFGSSSGGTGGTGGVDDTEITVLVPRTVTPVPTATEIINQPPETDPPFSGTITLGTPPPFTPSPPTRPPGRIVPTATAAATLAPGETPTARPNYTPPSITVPPLQTPPGTALVALPELGHISGLSSEQLSPYTAFYGFGEALFQREQGGASQPWLATDFVIAPDLSTITIRLRDDVPFHSIHGDFGNMTAEDVAWSMNMANTTTNPGSRHQFGSLFSQLWGEWAAVDDVTVQFELLGQTASLAEQALNLSSGRFTVFSKRAFEQNGEEWARNNIVATGPFEVQEWEEDTHILLLNRYTEADSHYIPGLTPGANLDIVRIVQVPEPTSRASLMRVGYADAAILRHEEADVFVPGGFISTPTASGSEPLVFNPNKVLSWEMKRAGEALVTDTWNLMLVP